jgi:hypothetical protein
MSSEFDREQELRRLLAEAVEPVEPAPGAQARLLARARAERSRKQRPLMARWAPAVLATLLVIGGVTVVFAVRGANRSNGSSAASTAGGAPSTAAGRSTAAAQASAAAPAPASQQLSTGKSASTDSGKGSGSTFSLNPNVPVPAALTPTDLDGDGRPDTFTLGAGTLAAQLSRYGLEAVSLPPLGPGAKVLGITTLTDPNGGAVPVVFVRLRQVGATATDTIAALVDGRLTVLQQGSGPVLLTIDASHGYVCSQRSLALAGNTTPLVIEGLRLVPSPQLRGVIASPAKTYGC